MYVTEATNFVLLASFLGIGIGFLNARSGRDYLRWTPVAPAGAGGLRAHVPGRSCTGRARRRRSAALGHIAALPKPLSFGAVFLLTVAVMAGLGQAVARVFVGFRPLSAYRLDILGSLAGIAVFSALSFLQQPPFVWGLVAGGGLAGLLLPKIRWWQAGAVVLVLVLLGIESLRLPSEHWSPYNKLVLHKQRNSSRPGDSEQHPVPDDPLDRLSCRRTTSSTSSPTVM